MLKNIAKRICSVFVEEGLKEIKCTVNEKLDEVINHISENRIQPAIYFFENQEDMDIDRIENEY